MFTQIQTATFLFAAPFLAMGLAYAIGMFLLMRADARLKAQEEAARLARIKSAVRDRSRSYGPSMGYRRPSVR